MSNTREEAIKLLKQYQGYEPMSPDGETLKHAFDLTDETVDTLLSALRPVSREQVEKAWMGHWVKCKHADYYVCNKCSTVSKAGEDEFCKSCGAPMTDKAMQMVMERLEALKDD